MSLNQLIPELDLLGKLEVLTELKHKNVLVLMIYLAQAQAGPSFSYTDKKHEKSRLSPRLSFNHGTFCHVSVQLYCKSFPGLSRGSVDYSVKGELTPPTITRC